MLRIWELYIDKKLSGDTLIRRAYADLNRVHFKWIVDPRSMTIQQWVDACCDKLKEEGHKLDETPLDLVKLKFIKYDIHYEEPKQYAQLTKAKEIFVGKYNDMIDWNAPDDMLAEMKKSIDAIETGIKVLLR